MELLTNRGGNEPETAKVVKRLRDKEGNPIGQKHDNPIIDNRMYEIE